MLLQRFLHCWRLVICGIVPTLQNQLLLALTTHECKTPQELVRAVFCSSSTIEVELEVMERKGLVWSKVLPVKFFLEGYSPPERGYALTSSGKSAKEQLDGK